MAARTTRQLEKRPTAAPLDDDLRALVALAVRVTERPSEVTPDDVAAAVRAARSPAEYLDAVGVIIAFNFVTRVANALGVEPEISPWVRRTEPLRQLVLKGMSWVLRSLVDLSRRQTTAQTPAENLRGLERLFADARLGPLPEHFRRLGAAPHLLESQRELLEGLLRGGDDLGPFLMDPELFLAVGRVVLRETVPRSLLDQMVGAPGRGDEAADGQGLSARWATIRDFAHDITRWSYRITAERVDGLRACGLGDADILDLVSAIALWNASGRLQILLTGLPASDDVESSEGAGRRLAAATAR
jgi:alkylhydroperoxidase family enzyme